MKRVWGRRSCREATRLMVQGEAEPLPWADRWALSWHLRFCVACRRFQDQMRLMTRATRAWRAYAGSDSEAE